MVQREVQSVGLDALGLVRVLPFCVVGPRSWAGSPSWSVPFGVSHCCLRYFTFFPPLGLFITLLDIASMPVGPCIERFLRWCNTCSRELVLGALAECNSKHACVCLRGFPALPTHHLLFATIGFLL